ncbi:MAG: hypothetical protein J1F29_01725 [Lentimicrobiaceae bacterium]|nr:hypothetical protein [Lentimicrobiaceae bacterium]
MKRLLVLVLVLFQGVVLAQLKTYKGPFAEGLATYTYKEDGLNRIFEGKFSYTSSNGQVSMSGNYINDRKNGLWKINCDGFYEEINYEEGGRHGNYQLKYGKNEDTMRIKAHFTHGNLDSMNFFMTTTNGRSIQGEYNPYKNTNIWSHMRYSKYIFNQYFYKGIYIGNTLYDNSTGDWGGEFKPEDMIILSMFMDTLAKYNFQYDGQYYLLKNKKSEYYKKLYYITDVFSKVPEYFNEIAYFFIYEFHQRFFSSSLLRGEMRILLNYTLCFEIVEDEIKTKAEKERIEREQREKERKKAEEISKFEKTEYGRLIKALKPFAEESEKIFENAKYRYIKSRMIQCYSVSNPIYIGNRDHVSVSFKYWKEDRYWKEDSYSYRSCNINEIPKGLKRFSMFAIPTAVVLINDQWVVSEAVIVYYYNGPGGVVYNWFADGLNLNDYVYGARMGADENGMLVSSSLFWITDDFGFHATLKAPYRHISCPMHLITPSTKYKRSRVYYTKWQNPAVSTEDFMRSITKEEVLKSIGEHYNFK